MSLEDRRTAQDRPRDDGLPRVAPDFVEQDHPEIIDDPVPTIAYHTTPMVGLGGSAGSIAALTDFFNKTPADSGMVFVVILHLSPTHESSMASILGRATTMPVYEAAEGMRAEPNHVYVIPPGKYLTTVNSHLMLTEVDGTRGRRVAVDMFFRSLADTHGPNATAVILSGADGDGALGIKRIKERGGLTIAQDPDEAEYPSMPRAAIDTGMVDWVLETNEMPGRIVEYEQRRARLRLPPEQGSLHEPPLQPSHDANEEALRDTLVFLRMRTGRDFSYYKRATMVRRIARRMQVNGIDDMPAYLVYLRTHVGEAGALLQDLLISVTNFFRDREVFEALELHLPTLFSGKTSRDSLRVWVTACATGEEAYSVGMLLLQHARTLDNPPSIQIFGTDLDDDAIQAARAGFYPKTITADVSEARIRQFFVKEHRGYRVRHELREMVLFSTHDLLKDAPFSRMDLISCRNLLIYLNRNAQQRAFDIFHFAMRPEALLLLGSSESIDEDSRQFRIIDKKHRIYSQIGGTRNRIPIPMEPSSLGRVLDFEGHHRPAPVVHGTAFERDVPIPPLGRLPTLFDRAALTDLHFRLVERYAPPSIIVNADHEIMHLSEHAGKFLLFSGGEPTSNLLRLVRAELRVDLRAALFRAAESNAAVSSTSAPVEIDGRLSIVRMHVAPSHDLMPGMLLVTFQTTDADADAAAAAAAAAAAGGQHSATGSQGEPAIRHVERELEQVKAQLRETIEQYEAGTEELKASNEELQAMNEELRSATEELETSREELQSINEELRTVNQEMKGKVGELADANSDLQNLMASTLIATVFLDRSLQITRYTPTAATIFSLIPGDVGRPLADLRHHLDYQRLIDDAEEVMRTLVPIEREVQSGDRWFLARLQPYRTADDHIAGVVLTFVDVTERNRATEALRQSEERYRLVINSAKEYAIFTTDPERHINGWNQGAQRAFGYSENEIMGQLADVLFTPEDRAKGDAAREAVVARDEGHAENERWHARKDGSIFYGSGAVMPLRDASGELRGFVKIMRDLTESKRTQEALREHIDELTRFNTAAVGRETRMIELKQEVNDLCARLEEEPRYVVHLEGPAENR